jgi:Ni/Fe-hydrogenase subunit HybB-like protein
MTTTFKINAVLAVASLILIGWRFYVGLGPSTGMTDTQPWGIWKLFNVVVLTALASGGYAIALLVYVLNRGHYHSLVRHALLTSAVGYTMAILALGIDVGSPWNFWKVLVQSWNWNSNSVLLEVAICISVYVPVLWAELSPAFMERWKDRTDVLGTVSRKMLPHMEHILIWVIGLGIVLPTMHQSSLGTMYVLAGDKVHPYWQTGWLPLFYLLSCWIMGYAAVITTYIFISKSFSRKTENKTMLSLAHVMSYVIAAFLVARVADLAWRGQLGNLLGNDYHNWFIYAEFGLLVVASIWLHTLKGPRLGGIFRSGMLVMVGGMLYRCGVVWLGYRPLAGGMYWPSMPELMVTIGFIAMQICVYLYVIKTVPILDASTYQPGLGKPMMKSLD